MYLYSAALETQDKKLKVLLALDALKETSRILREGEKMPNEQERMEEINNNPRYILLRNWYFQLKDQ